MEFRIRWTMHLCTITCGKIAFAPSSSPITPSIERNRTSSNRDFWAHQKSAPIDVYFPTRSATNPEYLSAHPHRIQEWHRLHIAETSLFLFGTTTGSKVPSRSRGTSIGTSPTVVFNVFFGITVPPIDRFFFTAFVIGIARWLFISPCSIASNMGPKISFSASCISSTLLGWYWSRIACASCLFGVASL